MEPIYLISQVINLFVAVISVFVLQSKTMKGLLIGNITVNTLAGFSYFLIDGYSATAISVTAVVQCVIMYFYDRKKQRPPLAVILIFIAAFIACSAIWYKGPTDILPGLAAVLFAISMACRSAFVARCWSVLNALSWIAYDILMVAFGGLVLHSVILCSVLVAMIRVDGIFKKEKKLSSSEN